MRKLAAAILGIFLLTGVFPATSVQAALTLQRGQSISIVKGTSSLSAVTLKAARVESVSSQSLTVSIFGLTYTINIAGSALNPASFTVGSHIDITGALDAVNPNLIHASGAQGAGIPPGGTGPGTSSTTLTGDCASGGQDGQSGGWEEPFGEAVVGLVRQAMGCIPTFWEFKPPSGIASGVSVPPNGTSPNHKFLWHVWYYGWAMRAGTEAQKSDARAKLIGFMDSQKTNGHYTLPNGGSEVLNTSHFQIWANAAAGARFLAFHHKDTALLASTGRWWRAEKSLWDVLQQNNSVIAPGARFHASQAVNAGQSQLRDVIYAMLSGRPLQTNAGGGGILGGAGVPTSNWWNDYYNVAAWTVRSLLNRGDNLGGAPTATAADIPKLPYVLCLYKKGADYVYSFPAMPNTLEPVFWVARIGGTKSNAPYVPGVPGKSAVPPPSLPGAALTVLAGASGSASDCTPAPGGTIVDPAMPTVSTTPSSTTPSSTANSTKAHQLIDELFALRKNTKDAGFSKNPTDKVKIVLNLVKMQTKIIELSAEVSPFSSNSTAAQAMAKIQPRFTVFNAVGIACTTQFVPHVIVFESCKRGLETTGGLLNSALDELKKALPVPSTGSAGGAGGTGSGGGGGGFVGDGGFIPSGPFDE